MYLKDYISIFEIVIDILNETIALLAGAKVVLT